MSSLRAKLRAPRVKPYCPGIYLVACLGLYLWAQASAAQVRVEVYDEPVEDLSSIALPEAPVKLAEGELAQGKLDLAADWLILPYFEVDTRNPDGRTTLYSIRNLTDSDREIMIRYYRQQPAPPVVTETVTLGPREVRPVSLRSVAGLPVDFDGFSRGFVYVIDSAAITPVPLPVLSGDYFQLDPANNFATGDRMLTFTNFHVAYDLCKQIEVRFLDGGAFSGGTDFLVFVNEPLGDGPADPPTLLVNVYSEAGGAPTVTLGVKTALRAFRFDASSILPDGTNFGVMEIRFNSTSIGHLTATYSAHGRFSVGLNALCTEQVVFP